ncbi:MAG TPA: baseplate J/gp47 family protein, partial [Kofleriaceae bacterium]
APLADLGAPAVRVMLRPIQLAAGAPYTTRYTELSALRLVGVRVRVDASGLCPQRLQSDERMLDPAKPFMPFGAAPALGSWLRIGHSELSGKPLDQLQLDLEWMGLPGDLATHYGAYLRKDKSRLVDVDKIAVDLSLIDRGQPTKLRLGAALFGATSSISVPAISPPAGNLDPDALSAAALPDELASWRRTLQCVLVGSDFGHAVYPALAASKAVDLATDVANQKPDLDADSYKVNPPYTPKLKSLSLTYSASLAIRLDAGPPDAGVARILYVHPFGQCDVHRELGATPPAAGVPFLPRYDNDGELYLGLTDVAPPQSVALLFQLAEGSADPDLPAQPVVWSYLDGDCWRPFAHRVLRDTTGGLTSAGIVELALDPVAPSARFGDGLYWIRAAVEQNTASVCDTIDIHPQAVSAVFVDHDNAPDHFRTPLSPGSIKKLSSRIAGIAGVRQPYTSRGGRAAEDPSRFATRVSERLRHKQRALSMWDYERLILENFPQVYKARCLPAPATAPGKVEIIVIPDIHDLLPSDPFEPKAPSSLLGEIANYLRGRMPAFADVVVRNPRYVSVRVRLSVRFRNAGNDAFYIRTLNDDLNRFLSPWAFDDGSDIVLGGRIYANSIVDFVDRRDYVDYVAGVQLFWRTADGDYQVIPPDQGDEGYFVTAASPDAVLVAARTHEITVLTEAAFDETSLFGINFMKVGLDFFVG